MAVMVFDQAYEKLLIVEGGYSNNKADRGGETFCGISRRYHPEWPGWATIDTKDLRTDFGYLARGVRLMIQVKTFYRTEYWDALKCDQLPPRIACELFDSGVNCGIRTAARWLQCSVNLFADQQILVEDGLLGEKTLAKTNVQVENFGETHLLKALNGEQYLHYKNIITRDQSQRVFLRGWLTRVWEEHC